MLVCLIYIDAQATHIYAYMYRMQYQGRTIITNLI